MAEVWRGTGFVSKERGTSAEGRRISVAEAKRLYNVADYLRFKGVRLPEDTPFTDWSPVSCPFHSDKHASASLSLRKNRFRCHACDIGGDVLDVVGYGEDLDTRGVLDWLTKNLPRRY
jgi:hypothetical protein